MAKPQQNPIMAERSRKLQPLTFAESTILSRDLPRDTILRRLELTLSGSVVTTYASGSPVADAASTFDRIIPRVDIVVNGSRTVKSVRPYIMQQMQLLATGILGERKSSAGASAATANNPTVDAGFTFGTTTQLTTVRESVSIYFEDVLAQNKDATLLNLKGVASAELRLTTSAFKQVQRVDDSSPVVYTSSTFVVDIETVEAQNFDATQPFADLKETTKEVTFSAQQTEAIVDINRGNLLRGLAFLVRDGDSTKALSNNAVTDLKLMVNGQNVIQSTNFKKLQAKNRARLGLSVPFASNVSRLDGFAWMDLLQKGDLSSALDVRPAAGVDNVQLLVSTEVAGSGATYSSYPVSLTVMTQEIVLPR